MLETSSQTTLIKTLKNPRLYGSWCANVEVIETHVSYVVLTGRFALKIKKAVNLGFLDFTTLRARGFYCHREVELNRRFAPGVYLGVVRLTGVPVAAQIDGDGPIIEYAVKMREFPQDALLTRVLAAGRLTASHIDQLAAAVAAFHSAAIPVSAAATSGTADEVLALAMENFTEIEPLLPTDADRRSAATLRAWTADEHTARRDVFAQRRDAGFVRACHGDLHLGNVALIDGRPTLFDCVEFNETMRWTDVMADVGFLVMDLIDRGQFAFASRFLNAYLEAIGDYNGLRVLRFYAVYRAMVRAKVAGMRAAQLTEGVRRKPAIQECRQYMRMARRLARSIERGLIITYGPTGSGKTTRTQQLVEDMNAVRVRTDVERKRLRRLPALARTESNVNLGIYSPADTTRTYDMAADISKTIIDAGFIAIADGTFLRRLQRDHFAVLARERGVPFVILDVKVDETTLGKRVTERQDRGDDASEANLAVLEHQLRTAEPLGADEQRLAITVGN